MQVQFAEFCGFFQKYFASPVARWYNPNMGQTVTTAEAAKLLGVCPRTVQRWIWSGRLPKLRIVGRAHLLRLADVVRLKRGKR